MPPDPVEGAQRLGSESRACAEGAQGCWWDGGGGCGGGFTGVLLGWGRRCWRTEHSGAGEGCEMGEEGDIRGTRKNWN